MSEEALDDYLNIETRLWRAKAKVKALEEENVELRRKLLRLQGGLRQEEEIEGLKMASARQRRKRVGQSILSLSPQK